MSKNPRQTRIVELVKEREIETQEELQALLKEDGYDVTQATVSRDIKKLRLTKEKTDALLEDIRNDSEAEAAKLRTEAEFNMREAVRFIISGVNEKCQ